MTCAFTKTAPRGAWRLRFAGRRGMTLIEILVVLGLVAILLTISVPTFSRISKKRPLQQAVNDIMEVCANARARAILSGTTMEVVFHPLSRDVALGGGGGGGGAGGGEGSGSVAEPPRRTGTSAHWDESLFLEMLDVNFIEYKDEDEAHVRFFPNGTCDELNVILRSEDNILRRIRLEVTTSLASVEDMR